MYLILPPEEGYVYAPYITNLKVKSGQIVKVIKILNKDLTFQTYIKHTFYINFELDGKNITKYIFANYVKFIYDFRIYFKIKYKGM